MSRKPLVGNQVWLSVYADANVTIHKAKDGYDYYKVVIKGKRAKYFYGELAWSDVPRFLQDELGDMKYWQVLD